MVISQITTCIRAACIHGRRGSCMLLLLICYFCCCQSGEFHLQLEQITAVLLLLLCCHPSQQDTSAISATSARCNIHLLHAMSGVVDTAYCGAGSADVRGNVFAPSGFSSMSLCTSSTAATRSSPRTCQRGCRQYMWPGIQDLCIGDAPSFPSQAFNDVCRTRAPVIGKLLKQAISQAWTGYTDWC